MEKMSYSYDEASDMFIIEGVYYSGQFFRDMGIIRPGQKFEVLCSGPIIKMRRIDNLDVLVRITSVIKNVTFRLISEFKWMRKR